MSNLALETISVGGHRSSLASIIKLCSPCFIFSSGTQRMCENWKLQAQVYTLTADYFGTWVSCFSRLQSFFARHLLLSRTSAFIYSLQEDYKRAKIASKHSSSQSVTTHNSSQVLACISIFSSIIGRSQGSQIDNLQCIGNCAYLPLLDSLIPLFKLPKDDSTSVLIRVYVETIKSAHALPRETR